MLTCSVTTDADRRPPVDREALAGCRRSHERVAVASETPSTPRAHRRQRPSIRTRRTPVVGPRQQLRAAQRRGCARRQLVAHHRAGEHGSKASVAKVGDPSNDCTLFISRPAIRPARRPRCRRSAHSRAAGQPSELTTVFDRQRSVTPPAPAPTWWRRSSTPGCPGRRAGLPLVPRDERLRPPAATTPICGIENLLVGVARQRRRRSQARGTLRPPALVTCTARGEHGADFAKRFHVEDRANRSCRAGADQARWAPRSPGRTTGEGAVSTGPSALREVASCARMCLWPENDCWCAPSSRDHAIAGARARPRRREQAGRGASVSAGGSGDAVAGKGAVFWTSIGAASDRGASVVVRPHRTRGRRRWLRTQRVGSLRRRA